MKNILIIGILVLNCSATIPKNGNINYKPGRDGKAGSVNHFSNKRTPQKKTLAGRVATDKSNTTSCNFTIGQSYQGGIIFYLDCTTCHGLIAAPTDQSTGASWYNGAFTYTTAFANGVNAGAGNSKLIVHSQGAGTYAAKLCTDLLISTYDDWYLPSKYELNLMYMNIGPGAAAPNTNIGGFASTYYWSSTEEDDNQAWYQLFLLGGQFTGTKNLSYNVRAIRAF